MITLTEINSNSFLLCDFSEIQYIKMMIMVRYYGNIL